MKVNFKNLLLMMVVLVLSLSGCQSYEASSIAPLVVKHIGVDDHTRQNVRQIVIHFDQQVTSPGGEPQQAQLAALDIRSRHQYQCHWRFIDAKRLACEFQAPLKPGSRYQIIVAQGFPGLSTKLAKTVTKDILTALPQPKNIALAYKPATGAIGRFSLAHQVPVERLQAYLGLVSPSGETIPLNISRNQHFFAERFYYDISLPSPQVLGEDGKYTVILKQGYSVFSGEAPLQQDRILGKFDHYRHLTFLGFACLEDNKVFNDKYVDINIDTEGYLPCDPEQLAIKFSKPLPDHWNVKGALSGGAVYTKFQHRGIIRLALEGNRQYRLDVDKVVGSQFEIIPQVLEFRTRALSAMWFIDNAKPLVIPAESNFEPQLGVRNHKVLQSRSKVIETAQSLLAELNAEGGEYGFAKWPVTTPQNGQFFPVTLPLRRAFKQRSGIAKYGLLQAQSKYSEQQLSVAAFNMAYRAGEELLLFVNDWHSANPIPGVAFSLLCKGFSEVKPLGYSDEHGVLYIKQDDWLPIADEVTRGCWIWGQWGDKSAAIEINRAPKTGQRDMTVHAWPIQPIYRPGDVFEIVLMAKRYGDDGIESVTDLSDYRLLLETDMQKPIEIALQAHSRFGFFYGKLDTAEDIATGEYDIVLNANNEIDGSKSMYVGYLQVESGDIPEFEVNIAHPEQLRRSERLSMDVNASRLNGVPLTNAAVEVIYEAVGYARQPDIFPSEYQITTSAKMPVFEEVKLGTVNGVLSDDGFYRFVSPPIEVDFDWAMIRATVTVTDSDGEIQQYERLMPYFAREHYIGIKALNGEGDRLEVSAFDSQGKPYENLDVTLSFSFKEDEKVLTECVVKRLPAVCDGPGIALRPIKVKVTSAEEKWVTWYAYTYQSANEKNHLAKPGALKLEAPQSPALVGNNVTLRITAPFAGELQLVVATKTIKYRQSHTLTKGENLLDLTVAESWYPGVKIWAYLAPKVSKTKLSHLPGHFAELKLSVQQKKFEFSATSSRNDYQSGQQVLLHMQADKTVDVVSWLVNDGLWQLVNQDASTYQLAQHLFEEHEDDFYWSRTHWFDAGLSTKLIQPWRSLSLAQRMSLVSGLPRQLYRNRLGFESISVSGAVHVPDPSQTNRSAVVDKRFVQSRFLGVNQLVPGRQSTLAFTMPQVPGRWKVVHVAADQTQFGLAVQTLTSAMPVEYFLDAPADIIQTDDTQLSITAINRQDKSVIQQLTLWIDEKPIETLSLALKAKEQRQLMVKLPKWSVGKHRISLSVGDSEEKLAQREISVASAGSIQQETFLYTGEETTELAAPSAGEYTSLALFSSPADSATPDWASHATHLGNYPHRCWEQNLSRNLAYHYSPVARSLWPDGQRHLNKLLEQYESYQDDDGLFSFFAESSPNAFLTAYSQVALHWLQKKGVEDFYLDSDIAMAIATKNKDHQARAMALLGLALSGEYTPSVLLPIQRRIRDDSPLSLALQLMALKEMKAAKHHVEKIQASLLFRGYQDSGVTIAGGNGTKCLVAAALGLKHSRSSHLIKEVLGTQRAKGHFGSTFADGVCTFVLQDRVGKDGGLRPLGHVVEDNLVHFEAPGKTPYWLKRQYVLPLEQLSEKAVGMALQREFYVKRKTQWQQLFNDDLHVGDIVKVVLSIDLPVDRAHIALTDRLAGGLEAVNPRLAGQLNLLADEPAQIQRGYVRWYPEHLSKGRHQFVYYAKVRYPGRYTAPPAKIEAMYNSDVWGRSGTAGFYVAGQK